MVLPGVAAAQQPQQGHVHEQAGVPKPAAPKAPAAPQKPKAFDEAQFKLLSTLTELIIPKTDTPGAIDAGVPFIIDANASNQTGLKTRLLEGMTSLDEQVRKERGKSFLELDNKDQIAVLTPMSLNTTTDSGRFFKMLKDMTIDAYYSTPEGLQQELGWNGRVFVPKFTGCTHKEHQA